MDRYNIFYRVHKGLRALLYDTAMQIQQTDFTNHENAAQTLAQLNTVIAIFEKHAEAEDNFVFAAVQDYEPSVIEVFEKEHVIDHILGEKLSTLLTTINLSNSDRDKISIGRSLNQAFIEFMIFNLEHMAKEEDIINNLLWRYNTDEELHGITRQILANIPPPAMTQFSKWMIRGLSNNEIINWLKEVKQTAPDFVYLSLLNTTAAELPASRSQLISQTLTEVALVA
jgi:hypothetical protein